MAAQEQAGKLIVPAVEDWATVARLLHLLAQDRKKKARGKSPRRTPTAKQELALDVLIAVSAAREGVTVVTNDSDFEAIRYYHKKLKLKRGTFPASRAQIKRWPRSLTSASRLKNLPRAINSSLKSGR